MNSNVNEYLAIHLSTKINEITIVMKMSDGNRKPTDVEIFLPKPVEKKNQTGNCIM
jgi:hypothetical protein